MSPFGTTYPQAWPRPTQSINPSVNPWTPTPGIASAFNWPQTQPAVRSNPTLAPVQQQQANNNFLPPQGGGGGFNLVDLVHALNAPSQLEQQHNDWVASGAPSYLGQKQSPFNNGYFGAAPGSNAFSGRTVATPQALAIPHAQDNVAGAVLASPAPVGTSQAGNQTGNPIDYNAIAALRQQALNWDPNGYGNMIQQQQQRQQQQMIGGIPAPASESGAGRFGKPSPFGQWR